MQILDAINSNARYKSDDARIGNRRSRYAILIHAVGMACEMMDVETTTEGEAMNTITTHAIDFNRDHSALGNGL
jgi:hypothetical protein